MTDQPPVPRMEPSFQALLSSCVERYPQEVRDLAETFCASTTRLGHHMVTQPTALTAGAEAMQRDRNKT